MKIKQTVLIIVAVIGLGSFFVAMPAVSVSAATCGGVKTSIIKCDQTGVDKCMKKDGSKYTPNPGEKCKKGEKVIVKTDNTGLWGVLLLLINILTAGVGIAAVGGIVVGSYMYMTAGGSPDRVKKANIFLTNVVLGIIVYAAMFAFLNFIIPGGLFFTIP